MLSNTTYLTQITFPLPLPLSKKKKNKELFFGDYHENPPHIHIQTHPHTPCTHHDTHIPILSGLYYSVSRVLHNSPDSLPISFDRASHLTSTYTKTTNTHPKLLDSSLSTPRYSSSTIKNLSSTINAPSMLKTMCQTFTHSSTPLYAHDLQRMTCLLSPSLKY